MVTNPKELTVPLGTGSKIGATNSYTKYIHGEMCDGRHERNADEVLLKYRG